MTLSKHMKIALGVVAVGAVAYFIYDKSKTDKAADAIASTPAASTTPAKTSFAGEKADFTASPIKGTKW